MFRCSMLMLWELMFPSNTLATHSKISENNETHQHTPIRNCETEKEVAMVIDNLQTYRKKKYFISFMHLAFIALELVRCLTWCSKTPATNIACASNEITLHRAISFPASQLNGLFSLLFFCFLHLNEGLCFYSPNSWFSDIIFEHHNNFLSNTGAMNKHQKGKLLYFSMFSVFVDVQLDFDSKMFLFLLIFLKFLGNKKEFLEWWWYIILVRRLFLNLSRWFSCLSMLKILCHIIVQLHSRNFFSGFLF